MELSDIGSLMNAVPGLQGKVAYRAFPVGEAPSLPFVTYLERSQEPFAADNAAYYVSSSVDIELYTEIRDEATEGLLEAALRRRPDLLLLDEPFLNLDARAAARLRRRVGAWLKAHPSCTAICVVHREEDLPPGFDHALSL